MSIVRNAPARPGSTPSPGALTTGIQAKQTTPLAPAVVAKSAGVTSAQAPTLQKTSVSAGTQATPKSSVVAPLKPEVVRKAASVDYVVVGAGIGGGTVMSELAEKGYQVRGVEAGAAQRDWFCEVPLLHGKSSDNQQKVNGNPPPRALLEYFVHHLDQSPESADAKFDAAKGGVMYPRGTGIGGSANVNANVAVNVDDDTLNAIAKAVGDDRFSAKNMRPYFAKVENVGPLMNFLHTLGGVLKGEGLKGALQSSDEKGWLQITRASPTLLAKDPELLKIVFHILKYTNTPGNVSLKDIVKRAVTLFDPNNPLAQGTEGFTLMPTSIKSDGRRASVVDRIHAVMQKRPDNLDIKTETRVHSLILNEAGDQAIGVRYMDKEGKLTEEAVGREVILAAGAFEDPMILMRSGIGPKAELDKLGIKPAGGVYHEAVGKNLKDRREITMMWEAPKDFALLKGLGQGENPQNDEAMKVWEKSGQGAYATNGVVASYQFKSDPKLAAPDIFAFFVPVPFRGYVEGYSTDGSKSGNTFTAILLDKNGNMLGGDVNPGSVTADAKDPMHQNIDFNYQKPKPGESPPLLVAMKRMREMFKDYPGLKEKVPGPDVKSDAQMVDFIYTQQWGHHANGTCGMGKDPATSVIDSSFRVYGLKNVRVISASSSPPEVNPGPFVQTWVAANGELGAHMLLEQAHADDAQKGRFSPLGLRLNQEISAKNTFADNLTIELSRARARLGDNSGVLTGPMLMELFDVTAKNGFSKQELADAERITQALTEKHDPNAPLLTELATHVRSAYNDQGFLLTMRARLSDVGRHSQLPSQTWNVTANKPEQVKKWASQIQNMQDVLLDKSGKLSEVGRAFHQKQLFGGVADVTVRDDVPEFLRFGPFAKPGKLDTPAAVRFSNGQGCPLMDKAPDVRGVAVKLFDGDKQPWDALATNQTHGPHTRSTSEFMEFAKVSEVMQTKGNAAGLKDVIENIASGKYPVGESARVAARLARDTALHGVEGVADETYFGGTFKTPDGKFLCKTVFTPVHDDGTPAAKANKDDPDYLSKQMQEQLKHGPVKMQLGIQVYTGDGKTPDPNDVSQPWDSPIYPVADLSMDPAKQNDAVAGAVNQMQFNPAKGFDAVGVTEDRKELYRASAEHRHAKDDNWALKAVVSNGSAP